jgi:hypothetical protein
MILVGNATVKIPRDEIRSTEDVEKSLMYEKLLSGLSKDQVNNLLDYIVSLK